MQHANKLQQEAALSWAEGEGDQRSERQGLRIIVLRNMPPKLDAETRRDIVDELSKFGDLTSIKTHEHTAHGGVVVAKFQAAFAAAEAIKVTEGRNFAGNKVKAEYWDGVETFEECEEEAERRAQDFGAWLEEGDEGVQ